MRARHVRMVLSAAVAAVVVIFGGALLSSVVIQSSLLLGTFSVGNILGSFGSTSSMLLVVVEGGLVFLMIMGGARVVLSQKLVRFTTYPDLMRNPKMVNKSMKVGGNYRGSRHAVRAAPATSREMGRASPRAIRASP